MSNVYFVHAPSVNLVKIGRSMEPERRFSELRLISPVPLEVIGFVSGDSALEADLHAKFAHLRAHGEWFHAVQELMEFATRNSLMAAWNKSAPSVREWFLLEVGA